MTALEDLRARRFLAWCTWQHHRARYGERGDLAHRAAAELWECELAELDERLASITAADSEAA